MNLLNWVIGVGLGTVVLLYLAGSRHKSPTEQPALLPDSWRRLSFFTAILVLFVALFSPLHPLATRYFSLHVLQRLLLVAVVPSLLLGGNPLPILLAGLPRRLQRTIRRLPQASPRSTHLFTQCTRPVLVWFLFAATFWLWHDAQIVQQLLRKDWLHRLENLTILGTGLLYWWHIMSAAPRLHQPMPLLWRVGYAALGATPVKLVGLVLMFSSTAVYQYPADISFYNLEVTDQSLGAAIVWAVGGIVFTWTAVVLMRSWLKKEDDKPALPESIWSSPEVMLAPGFGKSSPFSSPSK